MRFKIIFHSSIYQEDPSVLLLQTVPLPAIIIRHFLQADDILPPARLLISTFCGLRGCWLEYGVIVPLLAPPTHCIWLDRMDWRIAHTVPKLAVNEADI